MIATAKLDIRLPQALREAIDTNASRANISRAQLVKLAVIDYINKQAKTPVA